MHNTKAFRGREHQPSPKYCAQSHFSVTVLVQPKLCDQTCPRDAKGMKWWAGSGGCVAGGVPGKEAFSFSGQSFQKTSFSLDNNDNACRFKNIDSHPATSIRAKLTQQKEEMV